MSSPEPSIPAADAKISSTTAIISDLSIDSVFTRALIIILIIFFLVRLWYMIIYHIRNHDCNHNHYVHNIVPDPTINPNNQQHEGNIQNDAIVAVNFDVAINSYPSFMYSAKINAAAGDNDNDNMTCPICICEYVESEMMRMMPQCGHYFHLNCLDEWLTINWSCPVCRDSPSMPQVVAPSRS